MAEPTIQDATQLARNSYQLNPDGGTSKQVNTEGQRATYSASVTAFTPVATPTDFFNIFGSATKEIHITRLEISGTTTSAVETVHNIQIMKRSTAGTLGSATLTALTVVPHDSADAAGTAIPSTVGTANYTTLGTLVGQVQARNLILSLATFTATDFPVGNTLVFDFTNRNEKGIFLNNASEQLAINLNTETLVGTVKLDVNVTWTEE
jgi:hypothetical protein